MPAPTYSNLTDQDLLSMIEDRVLEPRNGGSSLLTSQFGTTPADALTAVVNALDQAQKDFLRDTGLVAVHLGWSGDQLVGAIGVAAGQERIELPMDMSDVRRRAWISFDVPKP